MRHAVAAGLVLLSVVAGIVAQAPPANTAFATELYQTLIKGKAAENQLFSPYAISTSLGLAAAGARGTAAAELNRLLRGAKPTRGVPLPMANSLWTSSESPIPPGFLALAARDFETSGVYSIDFRSNPAAARTKINQWVEDQTMGRIREVVPPTAITPNTAMVLANGVYFRGTWEKALDARLTRDGLMRAIGTWPYFEDDAVQVVSLPFAARGMSMVVVSPRKVDGLAEVEKGLTAALLTRWLAGLERRSGQVFLPKFALTGDAAPFSGVYHKALLELDEQGSAPVGVEAVPTTTFILRADRPFLFVIRAEPSNEILFMGRMVQPPAPTPAVTESGRGRGRGRGQRGVATLFKDPSAAAKAINELIAVTRKDSAFVSPQIHPGLWDLFGQIEQAANTVLNENSAAQTTLADGIARAIALAGQISNRGNESQANRDKALALQEKLREIANK
jgi:serpin B